MTTEVADKPVKQTATTFPYARGAGNALSVMLRTMRELKLTPEQFVAMVEKVDAIIEAWRRAKRLPTPFLDTAIADAIKSEAK